MLVSSRWLWLAPEPRTEETKLSSALLERRFDAALTRYQGTMRTFARNCVHQLPGFDEEDVIQELSVVLWKCVQNYDPDRGASFNTLFQGSAKNRVITLVRHVNTKGRKTNLVYLEEEAVAAAVAELNFEASAEDWALAIEELSGTLVGEVVKGRAARAA